ncbi:FIG016425: Soluble lytic murein transglycosylase and related regulatory proteins (some contain LysM/invasin domains) [hydrothermal vent metagenome]|uniref:FIG016425: Soluble lytic murein transglycosylase and related regulatory proteins (Some contain LysM/invasin domains) n=1 Tax=hydrothermal vent metagenome TaxID=652676 RepID=A0A3B1C7T1_9ZZZZ
MMTASNILIALICVLLSITQVKAAPVTKTDDALRLLLIKAINDSSSFNDRFDAEVWLVDMSARLASRIPDAAKRISMLKQIHYEATRAGLYPGLVLAVIDVESNFNRYAISRSGAMGLMQIMPFWLDEIGKPGDNLFDLETNLRLGCTILRYYMDKEKGNLSRALARYNGSLNNYRYSKKVYHALDSRWRKR